MSRTRVTPLTGSVVGCWTVGPVVPAPVPKSGKLDTRTGYICSCSCGTTRFVFHSSLANGISTNCGCVRRETMRALRLERGAPLDHSPNAYGLLTVAPNAIEELVNGRSRVLCVCACGNLVVAQKKNLLCGHIRSCGCIKKIIQAERREDLSGRRFSRLVVQAFAHIDPKKREAIWKCLCDCGSTVYVPVGALCSGNTKSCGCLQRDKAKNNIDNLPRSLPGELNHNWDASITMEERLVGRAYYEYSVWRKEVFARDKYTCQRCLRRIRDINAHHIEAYDSNRELRTVLSNGITLCCDCHDSFHHQYGRGDNTRAQFDEFMSQYEQSKSQI